MKRPTSLLNPLRRLPKPTGSVYWLLRQQQMLIVGLFLVLAGAGMAFVTSVPDWLGFVLGAVSLAVVLGSLLLSLQVARYDLTPRDDREKLQEWGASSYAYETVFVAAIMAIVLSGYFSVINNRGLLLAVLGVGMLARWWRWRRPR